MTINFQLKLEDLFALQRYVIDHSYTHYVKRMYFKWILTIIIGLSLLLFMNISIVTFFLSLIVAVVVFFITPILYNKVSFLRFKKQIESNDYSHVLGSCQMHFSEDGITRLINHKETFFAWDQFEKWKEDNYYFFLFQTDLQALIIPKLAKEINKEDVQYCQQWIEKSIINK